MIITPPLIARVERVIRDHSLFRPGDTVVVALSGGADSCALLHILTRLSALAPRLVVAHLNHCLRGEESDQDERFAAGLARHYALPFHSCRTNVRLLARQQGLNLEDAGRRARISFLHQVRQDHGAAAIALAHHADDQAETVLMRLLRGSGSAGLAGMGYRTGDGRIRPLLDTSREEIMSHLAEHRLSYREDASNHDTSYLRNRIRHELLPLLETYNPAIRRRLTATASLLSAESDLMDQLSRQWCAEACRQDGSTASCGISELADLAPALRLRALREMIRQLTGTLEKVDRCHIEALEHLALAPKPNARLDLPQGVRAVREYGRLVLTLGGESAPPPPLDLLVATPGSYPLPGGGLLTITIGPATGSADDAATSTACFDLAHAPFPWHIRTFRNGDRMSPSGMEGSKKVKDIFIDDKIPLAQRRRIPLVFCGATLIWICGSRIARGVQPPRPTSTTAVARYFRGQSA